MKIDSKKIESYLTYRNLNIGGAVTHFEPFVTENSWSAQRMAEHSLTISGSKIGAIAGECRWKSPLDVYRDMCLLSTPFAGNAKTRRGQALEHEIAYEASEVLHGKLGGGMSLVHPDFPGFTWQIDETLRSATLGTVLVECKWITFPTADWGDGSVIDAGGNIQKEDSQVPKDYADQVMWQLGIANAVYKSKGVKVDKAIISAIIRNEPAPRIYVINYDEQEFERLTDIAEKFLFENVMQRIPPENSEREIQQMKEEAKTHKTIAGDYENLEGKPEESELFDAAMKYSELGAQISDLKKQQDEYKKKLIGAIGDHEGVLAYGTVIATYKCGKEKEKFNEKLFAEQNPELYRQYVEVVPGSRTFSNKI